MTKSMMRRTEKLLGISQDSILDGYLKKSLTTQAQFQQIQKKQGIKINKHLILTWLQSSSEDANDVVNSCYFIACMNMHSDFSEMKGNVE